MAAMVWWDWVGIAGFAIGMVALAMTVQPFTQAFWGKPKIVINTSSGDLGNGTPTPYLGFVIRNDPIRKGFLALIGVTRDTAEEIVARVKIVEHQTNRVIVPSFMPKLLRRGTRIAGAQSISLPPSILGAVAAVIIRGNDGVFAAADEGPSIGIGEYIAEIDIGGLKKPVHFSARFTIQTNGTFSWD